MGNTEPPPSPFGSIRNQATALERKRPERTSTIERMEKSGHITAKYQVPRRVACGKGRGAKPSVIASTGSLDFRCVFGGDNFVGDNASPKTSAQMAAPLGSRNTRNNAVYARWLAGAVAALLVLDAFRVQVPEVTATVPFLKLGDWSYGLYLAHAVVILLIVKLWPFGAASEMAGWAALGGALMFGCAFGVVDVRLYANLKTRADAAADRTRQMLVTAYVAIFIAAILASYWSVSDQTQIRWLQEVVRSNGWTRLLSHSAP